MPLHARRQVELGRHRDGPGQVGDPRPDRRGREPARRRGTRIDDRRRAVHREARERHPARAEVEPGERRRQHGHPRKRLAAAAGQHDVLDARGGVEAQAVPRVQVHLNRRARPAPVDPDRRGRMQVRPVRGEIHDPRRHPRVDRERGQPEAPRDLQLTAARKAPGDAELERPLGRPARADRGRRQVRKGHAHRRRDRLVPPLDRAVLDQYLSDGDPEPRTRQRPGGDGPGHGCGLFHASWRASEPCEREPAGLVALDHRPGLANGELLDPEPLRPVELEVRGLDALSLQEALPAVGHSHIGDGDRPAHPRRHAGAERLVDPEVRLRDARQLRRERCEASPGSEVQAVESDPELTGYRGRAERARDGQAPVPLHARRQVELGRHRDGPGQVGDSRPDRRGREPARRRGTRIDDRRRAVHREPRERHPARAEVEPGERRRQHGHPRERLAAAAGQHDVLDACGGVEPQTLACLQVHLNRRARPTPVHHDRRVGRQVDSTHREIHPLDRHGGLEVDRIESQPLHAQRDWGAPGHGARDGGAVLGA